MSIEEAQSFNNSDVVKLNVGGFKFTTTIGTLRNIPDTMFSAMFSGRHTTFPNEEGYYFIDRDGTHFRHILNLLRSPTDFKIELSKSDMMELEREARFYCITDALEHARQLDSRPPSVTVTSAGYNVHFSDPVNYRSYFTLGEVTSPDGGRGLNVLLLNSVTREIISQRCFDFYGGGIKVVNQCIKYLKTIPANTTVLFSVYDDGASNVTTELFNILRGFGGSGRSIGFRGSFAMIGRKGMSPGQAVEAYDVEGNVVTVTANV